MEWHSSSFLRMACLSLVLTASVLLHATNAPYVKVAPCRLQLGPRYHHIKYHTDILIQFDFGSPDEGILLSRIVEDFVRPESDIKQH